MKINEMTGEEVVSYRDDLLEFMRKENPADGRIFNDVTKELLSRLKRGEELEKENKELKEEVEYERLRLAGCGVAAMANTEETIKDRLTEEDKYFSSSYYEVCRAVDREILLRQQTADLEKQVAYGQEAIELVEKIKFICVNEIVYGKKKGMIKIADIMPQTEEAKEVQK